MRALDPRQKEKERNDMSASDGLRVGRRSPTHESRHTARGEAVSEREREREKERGKGASVGVAIKSVMIVKTRTRDRKTGWRE